MGVGPSRHNEIRFVCKPATGHADSGGYDNEGKADLNRAPSDAFGGQPGQGGQGGDQNDAGQVEILETPGHAES